MEGRSSCAVAVLTCLPDGAHSNRQVCSSRFPSVWPGMDEEASFVGMASKSFGPVRQHGSPMGTRHAARKT